MARTADSHSDSPHTADGRPPLEQRVPEPEAAVVLTPEGQRQLAARAAWLATGSIPRFAYYLADPGQDGWGSAKYGHDVRELALLTRILQRAITGDQLPPENPGVVELGDEVTVEFATGYIQLFLVVNPIEARSSRRWGGPWSAAGSATRSRSTPPTVASGAASSPPPATRRRRCRGQDQRRLGDGRRDGRAARGARVGPSFRQAGLPLGLPRPRPGPPSAPPSRIEGGFT